MHPIVSVFVKKNDYVCGNIVSVFVFVFVSVFVKKMIMCVW